MPKRQPFDPAVAPVALWDDRAVQEALVRRKLGQFFALYCQYTGASQTDVAACIGRTQPEVNRLIRGNRTVIKLELLTDIADGLVMPDRARMLMGLTPASVLLGQAVGVSTSMAPAPLGRSPTFLPDVVERLGLALFALGSTTTNPVEAVDLATVEARVMQAWELRQQAQYAVLGTTVTLATVPVAAAKIGSPVEPSMSIA